jgi:hypothetical protein
VPAYLKNHLLGGGAYISSWRKPEVAPPSSKVCLRTEIGLGRWVGDRAIRQTGARSLFSMGQNVVAFEREFSKYGVVSATHTRISGWGARALASTSQQPLIFTSPGVALSPVEPGILAESAGRARSALGPLRRRASGACGHPHRGVKPPTCH